MGTSDIPNPVHRPSCVPDGRCSLGRSPNCNKLRDRFLLVQIGIFEKQRELRVALAARQSYCEIQTASFKRQILEKNARLRIARTNFAVATDDQNSAEAESHTKSALHKTMLIAYHREMKKCCDNQNELKSELCALKKIRGELINMKGKAGEVSVFITDCQVSPWQEDECSYTCGGGTLTKTRSVIVHPVGLGMKCPPLKLVESCNDELCPINCELEDWGGWSSCSAECGGGVMERSRSVKLEPEHDGQPCESTEEEQGCNIQSCDKDCELSEWGD